MSTATRPTRTSAGWLGIPMFLWALLFLILGAAAAESAREYAKQNVANAVRRKENIVGQTLLVQYHWMQYYKDNDSIHVGYVGHDLIDESDPDFAGAKSRAEYMVVALAADFTDAESKAIDMAKTELAEYIAGTKQLPDGVNRVIFEVNDNPLGPRGEFEQNE